MAQHEDVDHSRERIMRAPESNGSIPIIALLSSALLAAGCGSSATTATSPTTLTRCSVTLNGTGSVPAQGGAGTVNVSAARECAWSASTEGPWLSIRSGGRGQGDGAVEFAAAPNPDPAVRRGAVVLNERRIEVTQAPGECSFTLAESAVAVAQSGGTARVDLRASSALCPWTAAADVDWIVVRTGNGSGTAQVPFDVLPLAGAPRTGTIRVAGLDFRVMQAEGCAYSITPSTHAAGPSGGSGTISLTTTAGCPWTAASSVPWLAISPLTGTGPATLTFSVEAAGAPRSGAATIAGQTFTVSQGTGTGTPGCSFLVEPLTHAVPSAGGPVTVRVASADTCHWSASSTVPWVTVNGRASFTGSDSVSLTVATSTARRTGTVLVAGQTVTIEQAPGCSYSLSATSLSVPATGGPHTVDVAAGSGCAWTAVSQASWLTIVSASSGSGNGSVAFVAAPLTGGPRTGTMTIAGQTFTVTQTAASCAFAIAPEQQQVGAGGGTVAVQVSSDAGCAWTVAPGASWISVTPAGGTGTGTVQVTVASNPGPARSGGVTIAGRELTVHQAAAGCTVEVRPAEVERNWREWSVRIEVQTPAGCQWSAGSNVEWVTITSAASGAGTGAVDLLIATNDGPERTGTVTIGGRVVTVLQRRH